MDEPTSALERHRSRGAVQGHPRSHQPRRLDRLHLASPRRGAADHRPRRGAARRRDDRRRPTARTSTSNGSSATWSARITISARRRAATTFGEVALTHRGCQRADASGSDAFVGRSSVARRSGGRDRLHLRADGRRAHGDCWNASPAALPSGRRPGPPRGRGRLAAEHRRSASPRASCWCRRTGSATASSRR